MAAASLIELDDLVDNPTARVPIILCLDCSGSMSGAPIRELNSGVKSFYAAIHSDEIARFSAEISIVTFGPVQKETDFQTVMTQPHAPVLQATGLTPLGEAVQLSLDLLEQRKQAYKDNGIDYYQPWLVLMTDGEPNGSSAVLNAQISRVQQLAGGRKLVVFPIGIGAGADMATLNRFAPGGRPAFKLQGLDFQSFFSWLSASVSRVSQSTPGDGVELDVAGIQSWADFRL
ncbi:vWA domain-containing protein [Tessaracoccus lacteus]|uniref:VWA domain-containing protein n=1 Tax=Tessaracoccus lacteus TaxID=3041766 RepID=A0ABY8PW31_9ACTN|nr:VWA domain-containing protein [Tessaracoccus sp. T21]WGT46678.1 VWA domain-containing protein [Tessaracoccus sp. T21]